MFRILLHSLWILLFTGCQVTEDEIAEQSALPRQVLTEAQHLQVESWFQLARQASQEYDIAVAMQFLDSTLSTDSTHFPSYFERGVLYRRLGNYEASTSNYKQALLYEPELHDALYNLANNAFWENQHLDALGWYDALLEKKQAPAYWHNKGRAHLALGDQDAARHSFEEALRLDSTYAYGHASLGALAEQNGAYSSMLLRYRAAVRSAPESDEYWYKYGFAHARLDETAQALAAFDSALVINPFHFGALFNKARIWIQQGHPEGNALMEKANALREEDSEINRLIRGSTRFPDDAYYHYALGNKYAERKQWSLSERQFLRALALEPQDTRTLMNLGNVYAMQSNVEAARRTYLEALELEPASVDVLQNLAVLSMQAGDFEEAETYWKAILSLNPDHELAVRGMAFLEQR